MKAAASLVFLALALGIDTPAWCISTDDYVATSLGTRRAYAVSRTPGSIFIYDYLGGRANSEYTIRYVLPNPVMVNGEPHAEVREAPQGYAEYWMFGAGARLSRIDEGDYNDQLGIGVFNRQNAYTPAIPVLPQDAVAGSILTASGTLTRTYNSLVLPQTLQFESSSQVVALEPVEIDGLSRQAFRVETTIHHWGQLFDTPDVDYTITLTNLFVQGVGLIPVRTQERWQVGSSSYPNYTIVSYQPVAPATFTAAPVAFAPRTGIPPGVAIDFSGQSPLTQGVVTEVSISNGQFAGQQHPPASTTILQGIYVVRTRAPAAAAATGCGALVVGQSAPSEFCVMSWSAGSEPQSGVAYLSEWGDSVGASWADYFPAPRFSARRGSVWIDEVLNDKVYTLTFDSDDPARGWVHFSMAMPDYDWPRRGAFNALRRVHASVGMTGRGCNQSLSDVVMHDIQYDANRNITSFAADVKQHCEGQPQALLISLRYNSRIPFNPFYSSKLRPPYALRADFDRDFRSDVLWRNSATGETYIYPMNGTQTMAGEGYLRAVPDVSWRIAGMGDFYGDGRADILWRNASTGQNYIWPMNGTTVEPGEGYIEAVPDLNWRVAGVGDFDGDGKDDILWRNPVSGENYLFLMDGRVLRPGSGYLRTVADTAWQIAGVADFNGDARADILWRHATSGENYLYLMNGLSIVDESYLRTVVDTNWQIKATGDFDGDGRADIAWRNSTSGENYLFLMSGTSIAGEAYSRTVADLNWQIAAVGDYDGDGKDDILWRNASTGENYLYFMDGLSIKPTEGYLRSVPPGSWNIVGR